MKWEIDQRTLDERSQREFRHTTLRTPLRHRIDVVLIAGLLLALVILVGGWFSFVTAGERLGWFDAPVVQPLEDERILTNVRTNLRQDKSVLLDAIVHTADESVILSEEEGIIHRYDPQTHLWSTDVPFSADAPVDKDFDMLRSGCGADLYSNHATRCSDTWSIWAKGADGSLARYRRGDWEIVLNNTKFAGADETYVEDEDLTTAALTDDDQWLLLGTRDNGIGLYNLPNRTWSTIPPDVQKALPALEITHLAWWGDRFWIGTPEGLAQAKISRDQIQITADESVTGEIIDLDADPDGALWVLEERPCQEHGETCLWFGTWDRPNSSPRTVLDQQNHFPELNLNDLQFAQLVEDNLVLAGQAGIYGYDNRLHSWQRLFDKAIITILPNANEHGFYFAYDDGIGLVENGALGEEWEFGGHTPVKLLHGRGDELLIFTDKGDLIALSTASGEVEPVFESSGLDLDPATFTSAIAIQDTVLLIGAEGALLHDTRTRSYDKLESDWLPTWLLNEEARLLDVGDSVFVVTATASNEAAVYVALATDMVDPLYYDHGYVTELTPVTVPGPIERIWRWGDEGLGLLGGDGSVYFFDADDQARLTGPPEPALNGAAFRDVAQTDESAVFIVDDTLREYSLVNRSWSEMPDPLPDSSEAVVELAAADGQLLLRTDRGRLLQENGDSLIGDENGIVIADGDLTDVWEVGQSIYLAGAGRVEEYDSAGRQIADYWEFDSGNDVLLKGIINSLPLAQIGTEVALRETMIEPEAGDVISVSADNGFIWTVRDDGQYRYLKGYIDQRLGPQNAVCLFRTPVAPGNAREILDARELPNGAIAVVTNDGVRFYSPQSRTWYDAPQDLLPADRLYRLQDSHLLLVQGQESGRDFRLVFVPLSFDLPHSCSQDPVQLRAEQVIEARAVAVNESTGQVAWIEQDGSVVRWTNGAASTVLDAARAPQSRNSLRRLFDHSDDGSLLFSTDSELWRYDLQNRAWSQIELDLGGSVDEPLHINIEPRGDQNTITVRTGAGDIYLGNLNLGAATVELDQIYAGRNDYFGAPSSDLVDIQERRPDADVWTFVLRDRLKYYDPQTRLWQDIEPGTTGSIQSFEEALGRGIVVGDQGNRWYIAENVGSQPNFFVEYELEPDDQARALDGDGDVWRLANNGELQRCSPSGSSYLCSRTYAPFYIEDRDILRAYEWAGHVIFELSDGMRTFDESSGEELPLEPAAADTSDISAVFPYDSNLFIYSDSGDSVILFDRQMESEIFAQVQALVLDEDGRPWALFADGWRYYTGTSFEQPLLANGDPASGITLYPYNETAVTGLDAAFIPHSWSSSERLTASDLPLPADISVQDIELLVQAGEDWWILSGDEWLLAEKATCVEQVETSDESTAEAQDSGQETDAQPDTAAAETTEPFPCLQVNQRIPAAPAEVVSADWAAGKLTVVYSNGQIVEITAGADGNYSAQEHSDMARVPTLPREDRWSQLRSNLGTLPSSQTAYDPVIELSDRGGLKAIRHSGKEHQLATQGALAGQKTQPFDLPPALDAGWLRWDRETGEFVVATNNGSTRYERDEFIIDEQLLFEQVTSLLARSPNDLYASTPHGIWRHRQQDLSLVDSATNFPVDLPQSITAVHDQFIIGQQAVTVDGNALSRGGITGINIPVGDATFVEESADQEITASVRIGGKSENAFSGDGFIWDSNRRGLAFNGSTLLMQSDAGIQPLADLLAGFDPGPNDLGRVDGVLQSDTAGNAYLHDASAGQWYRLQDGGWQEYGSNPHEDRDLVSNSHWDWSLQNGESVVSLKESAPDFQALFGNLGFNSDSFLAAAAWQDELFVATEVFLEIGGQIGDFHAWQTNRLQPVETDRFETIHFADDSIRFFNFSGDDILQWNSGSRKFEPLAGQPDPLQTRELAGNERLRFSLDNGLVSKQLRIDDIDGGSRWESFNFQDGQFPFDYVTSVALFDDSLYLGTAAGLAVHNNPSVTALNGLSTLVDMRDTPPGDLLAVSEVGVPEANDNLLVARSDISCIEISPQSSFTQCENEALLDRRLRVETPFWQWTADADDGLVGQYRKDDGSLDQAAIRVDAGRLPHDRVGDAIVCQGNAMTLWDGSWISVYTNDELKLGSGVVNYNSGDKPHERLICFARSFDLVEGQVQSGAYLEAGDGDIWRFDGGGWSRVEDEAVAESVIALTDNPPVFYRDRMRLLLPQDEKDELVFEQRSLDGEWHELPWTMHPQKQKWFVATDHWRQVEIIDDQMWGASAAGLINVERPSNTAALDTNNVIVVREPRDESGLCPVTDIMAQEGNTYVRCSSSSSHVFGGELSTNKDSEVFETVDADPFAEQMLVSDDDSDYWNWLLTGQSGGQPGRLQGALHGEEIILSGGRFSFDTINSVARFNDDKLEIGTDTGGWYEGPKNGLPVVDVVRPQITVGEAIEGVGITFSSSERMLCLRTADGSYIRLAADGTQDGVESCPEYLGSDSLWLYTAENQQLNIEAPDSIGGLGNRKLIRGRFNDNIAAGLPIAMTSEGELRYLFPTEAGVTVLDRSLAEIGLHAGDFAGLDEGAVPTALYLLDQETAIYADDWELHYLDESRGSVDEVVFESIAGATPRGLVDGYGDSMRMQWQTEDNQRGWISKDRALSTDLRNGLVVDVSGFERYVENQIDWGAPPPWLTLQITPETIRFYFGSSEPYETPLPEGFDLIDALLVDTRLLVIGQRHLLDVDLESAMSAAIESER